MLFQTQTTHVTFVSDQRTHVTFLFQTKQRMLLFFQTKHRMFSLPDNTLVLFEKIHFYIIIITILLSFLSFETLH